jgi:hypothetical protein
MKTFGKIWIGICLIMIGADINAIITHGPQAPHTVEAVGEGGVIWNIPNLGF